MPQYDQMSDEDEPVCLDELGEAERLATVDVCVHAHVEAGKLSVKAPRMAEEEVQIIYQSAPRSPGERPWSLRCNLNMDEERSFEFGEVNLVLELDNRLGLLVTIALLDCGIDDWRDEPYELAALLDDLEPLAQILEKLPIAGLSACRYCNTRIDAQAIGTCSNCGAAL